MRIAVSLPDDLFEKADRLARKMKNSRSQLYAVALAEFLARHDAEEVTAALDRVCGTASDMHDPAASSAARHVLRHIEW
ncbi:MAG: ribbon-helix-helix protein, CopG family [Proteobacteria bacterium]|nr:ribbon-helix-helix protein, CopG family [Pseudomonadota bacterium]